MRQEIRRIVTAGFGLSLLGSACGVNPPNTRPPEKSSISIIGKPITLEPTIEVWDALAPLEKLNRLLVGQYPSFESFEPTRALLTSIREYLCIGIDCDERVQQTPNNILELSTQNLLETLENFFGRPLSETEIKDLSSNEVVLLGSNVLINDEGIRKSINEKGGYVDNWFNSHKNQNLDRKNVIISSSFFRILGEAVQSNERIPIDENTSQELEVISWPISIKEMEGFIFKGKNADGQMVDIEGLQASTTELLATFFGQFTAGYIVNPEHIVFQGATLLARTLTYADIDPAEFIDYATAKLPKNGLFRKLGSLVDQKEPDENAAIKALAALGLGIEQSWNMVKTARIMEDYLHVPLS